MMTSPGFYAGRSVTLSFFASSVSTAVLALPAGILAGDLIIFGNFARNNIGGAAFAAPAGTVGSGSVLIIDQDTLANTRVNAWFKLATGVEGGGNPGGTNGGVENNRWAFVFRPDVPIGAINITGLHVEQTNNAPANQVLVVGTPPLVAIAGYRSNTAAAAITRGFSPAEDAEISPSTLAFIKRKLFNGTPVTETISMNDAGDANTLFSFNIEALAA